MRKSFFLSVLALAAVVSCQKSEIVDSKFFNEEIGFESYIGRDAQTKASVADAAALKVAKGGGIGVYGFYTANDEWSATTTPNLLDNENLYYDAAWKYDNTKYWTNDTDMYTFLAYAPYGNAAVVPTTKTANPTVTYTVPATLAEQVDLLYSNDEDHVDMNKGTVALKFQHALARLTVKASATAGDFTFHVKEVSINGKFNTSDVLTLSTGAWATGGAVASAATTYTFYTNAGAASTENALSATAVDYAGTNKDNYLMMIPTNFSAETDNATLTVKYTTFYAGQESTENTKTFKVATNFEQGKAYTINLGFELNTDNVISFSVEVANWDETTTSQDNTIKG